MTYPDERTMGTLEALSVGTACEVWDDARMRVTTPRGNWEALGHEVDELESRGWVELRTDDTIAVTEPGRYWLARWLKKAQPSFSSRGLFR